MTTPGRAERDAQARAILHANDHGAYTIPNRRVYPFQWNWDSAFVAMGLACFDLDRGWRELESLFAGQWADGMVPSIVFHAPSDAYFPGPDAWGTGTHPPTTGISQPPVAATAARFLWTRSRQDGGARARLDALFVKLMAWHRWWHEIRDPQGSGLVMITHPWESGRDNSPDWDGPLAALTPTVRVAALRKDNKAVDPGERPSDDFYDRVMTLVEEGKALGWDGAAIARRSSLRACDLGVQCILMRADRDLRALATALGRADDAATIEAWLARSSAAFGRLCAADGTSRSLDLRTGALAPAATSASFLPLYARVATQADADRLADLAGRWWERLPYGIASCDPDFPGFDPARYWRGPVWLVVNRMIADGFAAYGHRDLAGRIAAQSAEMVERHGFREYFDPRGGEGLGGHDFSWSAAMWLAWLSPQAPAAMTDA